MHVIREKFETGLSCYVKKGESDPNKTSPSNSGSDRVHNSARIPLKTGVFGGTTGTGTTLLKKSEGPKIIFSCFGTDHSCVDFFALIIKALFHPN
jgi:hypothetical protein